MRKQDGNNSTLVLQCAGFLERGFRKRMANDRNFCRRAATCLYSAILNHIALFYFCWLDALIRRYYIVICFFPDTVTILVLIT